MTGAYKITPEHFDAMVDILNGVPGSVLWLRDQTSTVLRRFEPARRGARRRSGGGSMFAPNEPVPRYLKRFRLADLFLDTMPVRRPHDRQRRAVRWRAGARMCRSRRSQRARRRAR